MTPETAAILQELTQQGWSWTLKSIIDDTVRPPAVKQACITLTSLGGSTTITSWGVTADEAVANAVHNARVTASSFYRAAEHRR